MTKSVFCWVLAFVLMLFCGSALAEPSQTVSTEYNCEEIFDRCLPSVVYLEGPDGGGTGFYVDEHTILTNYHVIEGVPWLKATLHNGRQVEITEILGWGDLIDLALLHIDERGVPLPLNTHEVHTGEPVYIIGAPLGIYPCISNGIVMMNEYSHGVGHYILSNVHSMGGNSGGPAINRYGEVMGVVSGGMMDGPNSIDMIIKNRHMEDINDSHRETLQGFDSYIDQQNTPDETLYEIAGLQEAQPGQLVRFGTYEQDNDLDNGPEDILWIVEERDGDELMLLSLYCLDSVPYNETQDSVTWETSTIRAYLNNEFFQTAFSEEDQAKIVTTNVYNGDNPVYGTSCGNNTQDKVYLLSLEEVKKFWGIGQDVEDVYDNLYAQATQYCMSKSIWLEIPCVNRCWWWLRTMGVDDCHACEVGAFGYFSFHGGLVDITNHTIRPVTRVRVK